MVSVCVSNHANTGRFEVVKPYCRRREIGCPLISARPLQLGGVCADERIIALSEVPCSFQSSARLSASPPSFSACGFARPSTCAVHGTSSGGSRDLLPREIAGQRLARGRVLDLSTGGQRSSRRLLRRTDRQEDQAVPSARRDRGQHSTLLEKAVVIIGFLFILWVDWKLKREGAKCHPPEGEENDG